jgi:hypothetical protein
MCTCRNDDETSANIKEIEKLFGTHHAIKVVYDDESYKFSMFSRLLSESSWRAHPAKPSIRSLNLDIWRWR